MAVGLIPSKVRSFFRRLLEKRRRRRKASNCSSPLENEKPKHESASAPAQNASDNTAVPDSQLASPFLSWLPIEVRQMIYGLVWNGPYDHKYHNPRGRHVHFQDGHWTNTRCVMYEDDENLDFIQNNMDKIHSSGKGDLLMWQRRLSSTWGCRHWRCEERVRYGKPTSIDRTNFMSMMLVCKRMFPEVTSSILESHQLIFTDLFSAHRFFVSPSPSTSPYLSRIRHLDLSLTLPFYEYAPFTLDPPSSNKSRVRELGDALRRRIACLHSLRVALDVYDRGPWRKIPERAVVAQLRGLSLSLRRGGGFTLELPPELAIKVHLPNMQGLDEDEDGDGDGDGGWGGFRVVRRPRLRYWQFVPGEVERFTWKVEGREKGGRGRERGGEGHCYIALEGGQRDIANPYLVDFFARG
ncbi:uncharacterized protein GGS25DRAFT_517650 [Hypoxylon fragiforme]|uniref:uncharacterized protein n=1 Tax=Hypoxylon fragiforme TaxID=63214 RepID=UPI0020C61102|nr:uncharacterized protein GGS25DRAFT_517650 [Hypoxylon fragiforme]KAI2614793.1 hypothetical protein GGS25DRAFT_517650 [Hypoxylon fragiforme]